MNILHTRDNKKCIYIYNYIYIGDSTQPNNAKCGYEAEHVINPAHGESPKKESLAKTF
jgi:hypothetical protein